MSLDAGLRPRQAPARPHFVEADGPAGSTALAVPVLIQVPAVGGPRAARRPSAAATARLRAYGAPHARFRPRRRLRKEVRAAGYVLLMAAPLAFAAALLRQPPEPAGGAARGSAPAAPVRPPAVTLSVEPAPAPGDRPETPVVLPGYLLPDDGS